MSEIIAPLGARPSVFIGTKPDAVIFGDMQYIVRTWREAYEIVIGKRNADPRCHEPLTNNLHWFQGSVRKFLSNVPDGMKNPLKVDETLWTETHYGSETLMNTLVERILRPVGFDYSGIRIAFDTARRSNSNKITAD
jgi:hypothetical protein